MASFIRQITAFDMPDGGIGVQGGPWGYAFPSPTLAGSTIVCFTECSASQGSTIAGLQDSFGNSYTMLDNENNTDFGAEYWSGYKPNAPSYGKGYFGRVGSGTATTLTDDTLSSRGVTWTTNQYAGLPYVNFANGDTGVVTSNDTSGTLTISGMANTPGAKQLYVVGDYIRNQITLGSGYDYFGGVALEVSGVTTSPLIGHNKVQNTYTNGQVITCPSGALGSSPVIILAFSLCDRTNTGTPAVGTGFSDDGIFLHWDLNSLGLQPMARLEHQSLSNPGTAGATFGATANDHYQALYVALLDSTAPTLILPGQSIF